MKAIIVDDRVVALATDDYQVCGYEQAVVEAPAEITPQNIAAYVYRDGVLAVSPPDRVTSRQFKLQLLADGLLDTVDAWIAAQDRGVQLAYEYSGTFVRDEPMTQAGFAALGFTPEQIDAFFAAAAEL